MIFHSKNHLRNDTGVSTITELVRLGTNNGDKTIGDDWRLRNWKRTFISESGRVWRV